VPGAERRPDPGIEKTEVIVDPGDGPDRAPGIPGGGLLPGGNGRREAFDGVHIRLLHDAEELPGVRGEGFDIAALAFRVKGIERERGFAGAGDAGYDDQLVAGNGDADIFEVVLAGTFDDDIFHVRVLGLFGSGSLRGVVRGMKVKGRRIDVAHHRLIIIQNV